MEVKDIAAVVAIVLGVINLAYLITRNRGKDVEDVKERLVKLETKVDVFWKSVSFDAAKILHSPHPEHARRDYLLEQLMDERISMEELKELAQMLLKTRDNEEESKGERLVASQLLRALQQQYEV